MDSGYYAPCTIYCKLQNKFSFSSSNQQSTLTKVVAGCTTERVGSEFSSLYLFGLMLMLVKEDLFQHWSGALSVGWFNMFVFRICMLLYMFNFLIVCEHRFSNVYIMCASQHVFLSFHSVSMFRCPSSMKENRNWLSKTTLEEESGADSIIYPESHFWLVAAAGSGMYSCPVATMFCEKLLTRRDIAENLRASVIWIRLSFCVVGKKVKMFEKIVVSIQKLTPCNDTAWRETHRRIIFTFFESCCTNMKTLHSSIGNFIWNISPDFWYFILKKRVETYNFRMPELSLRFHGASSGSYGIGPCGRTIC